MLGYRPIFCICCRNPKNAGEMQPPFSHRPKNESHQNQKQNMPNKRSCQRMKKIKKKTSSSGVIYV